MIKLLTNVTGWVADFMPKQSARWGIVIITTINSIKNYHNPCACYRLATSLGCRFSCTQYKFQSRAWKNRDVLPGDVDSGTNNVQIKTADHGPCPHKCQAMDRISRRRHSYKINRFNQNHIQPVQTLIVIS